jgi:mono/diheme cytochrome c family protein
MKKIPVYLFVFMAGGLITLGACADDPVAPSSTVKASYTSDVAAIYNNSCAFAGCHNIGSPDGSLANYEDSKTFARNENLLGAIKHEAGASPMPKNANKLSDANIATIEKWITDGLLE